MVIGVISDTHGRISKQALDALEGSHAIIHAGDVGSPKVIKALEEIAHVYPVRAIQTGAYGQKFTRVPAG